MSEGKTQAAGSRADEVRRKHGEFFWPAVTNYYQEPLVLESGSGL